MSVAGGVGIALLPAALLNDLGFASVLRPVLMEWPLKESTLYLIYGSRKNVPFKARAFIDLVLEGSASSQEKKHVGLAVNLGRGAPERHVAALAC
jgi:DNA-binding transcriptional LysR family regulator